MIIVRLRMVVEFITKALGQATYEILEDGQYYGEIPVCPGVWATGKTLEQCRATLQEVLEDWLLLKLRDGDSIPVIEGVDLNIEKVV